MASAVAIDVAIVATHLNTEIKTFLVTFILHLFTFLLFYLFTFLPFYLFTFKLVLVKPIIPAAGILRIPTRGL